MSNQHRDSRNSGYIEEAVAWCGPHKKLFFSAIYTRSIVAGCFPLESKPACRILYLSKKEQVDEESNNFTQARLIVTIHKVIEINQ